MTLHCRLATHMPAKFEGLLLLGLSVTFVESRTKNKNFGAYGRIGIFYVTPFPCTNSHDWSLVYFDELNNMKVSNLILKLKQ